jgi:hypothetical protein
MKMGAEHDLDRARTCATSAAASGRGGVLRKILEVVHQSQDAGILQLPRR